MKMYYIIIVNRYVPYLSIVRFYSKRKYIFGKLGIKAA